MNQDMESDLERSVGVETKYTEHEVGSSDYDSYRSYSLKDYINPKIIEGPVRMTMAKATKVGEYILAAVNPQWNMPTLSKMDYDTLYPSVVSHTSLGSSRKVY